MRYEDMEKTKKSLGVGVIVLLELSCGGLDLLGVSYEEES